MLDFFVEVTEAFGQEVSVKKTKVMVIQKRVLNKEKLVLDTAQIFFCEQPSAGECECFYVCGRQRKSIC